MYDILVLREIPFVPIIIAHVDYDKYVLEEVIEFIASFDPPLYFPPLFTPITSFLEQLVQQKTLVYIRSTRRYVLRNNTTKYLTRKISINIPEYNDAILLLRNIGAEHKGVIVPGISVLLNNMSCTNEKSSDCLRKVVHILIKIINDLSDLGYDTALLYEEDVESVLAKENINLGFLCESYNSLVTSVNTSINGILVCKKTLPVNLIALLDTKMDFIVFNPVHYKDSDIENMTMYLNENNIVKMIGLAIIDYLEPPGLHINRLINTTRLFKNQTLFFTNTCNVWKCITSRENLEKVLTKLGENYGSIKKLLLEVRTL